jgi:hypothetical protein
MSIIRDTIEKNRILIGNVTANNEVNADLFVGKSLSYFAPSAKYFEKPLDSVLFTKVSAASISIPAGFYCLVDTVMVNTTSIVTLSLNSNLDTGTKTAGTDYYVYALTNGNFIISANNSYPSGYSASTSRKIGGFHYGVIPEGFTAINNITSSDATAIAGINTYSFWDLKYRPVANPEGMVKIGGSWYDIYLLNSEHIINGTSKAGATIAAGGTDYGRAIPKIPLAFGGNGTTTYGSFTWFEAGEIANAYGKDLISYKEFAGLAYGVLEEASWGNSSATIQHVANHTSKWGTCQATGVEWIWGADINNGRGSTDFAWRSGLTETRGQIYATSNAPTAALLGGHWSVGSNSGSRCSYWTNYVWDSNCNIGCRFSSDHLMLV